MDKRPLITISCLGTWGRFANSLFQYAFLRVYAKKNNFRIQVPMWIGHKLFGCNEPLITEKLPFMFDGFNEVIYDGTDSNIAGASSPPKNVDINGYFQYHSKFYLPYKDFFCSLFKPLPEIYEIVKKSVVLLKSKGNTIIGLHLRRGDFEIHGKTDSGKCFFVAPCEWYLDWLNENWSRFDKPVLFIASDESEKVVNNFSKYSPVTNKDLGIVLGDAPDYPDFYTLSQCDIMCISNSSYSFMASLLNEKCKEFYRPRLSTKKLISYSPWESPVMLKGVDL